MSLVLETPSTLTRDRPACLQVVTAGAITDNATIPAGVNQAAFVELVSLFLVDTRATVEGALAKAGDVRVVTVGVGGESHKLPCACALMLRADQLAKLEVAHAPAMTGSLSIRCSPNISPCRDDVSRRGSASWIPDTILVELKLLEELMVCPRGGETLSMLVFTNPAWGSHASC